MTGDILICDEYLQFFKDFVEAHEYIDERERGPLLEKITEMRRCRREGERWFYPGSIRIPFSENMFEEDNYFGFIRASLRDGNGKPYWDFYSTRTRYPYSEEHGELQHLVNDSASMGYNYETQRVLEYRYYAFFGPRNNRTVLSNTFYLTQGSYLLEVFMRPMIKH